MMQLVHHLLENSAEAYPAKICLVHKSRSFSFCDLNEKTNQLAHLLMKHGIHKGDRVGIHLEKSIEEVMATFAITKAGGVFVNLNQALKIKQISHILNDCSVKCIITSDKLIGNFAPDQLPDSLDRLVVFGKKPAFSLGNAAILSDDEIGEGKKTNPCMGMDENDLAAILYTSGSTGLPKGVMLTHKNIVVGALSVSTYLHNTRDDIILSLLPFSFDYGLNQLMTAFRAGAKVILKAYNMFVNDIVDIIIREKVTGLAAIPTMWMQLLQAKNISSSDFKDLRYITNSGGKIPVEYVKQLRAVFPYTKIYLMYGFTESFRCTYLDPDQVDRRPDSIGKTIPYSECFVVNEQGRECGAGEVGELIQRGPLVSMGYWGMPEESAKKIKPNPLTGDPGDLVCYSGDYVKKDEEGYLYFIERKDEMIKCSGHRISPTEIEQLMYENEHIKEAVALGVPDELLGQTIKLVVVLKEQGSLTQKDLLNYCKNNLPSYMQPAVVQFLVQMPYLSNGKIDRSALKTI